MTTCFCKYIYIFTFLCFSFSIFNDLYPALFSDSTTKSIWFLNSLTKGLFLLTKRNDRSDIFCRAAVSFIRSPDSSCTETSYPCIWIG